MPRISVKHGKYLVCVRNRAEQQIPCAQCHFKITAHGKPTLDVSALNKQVMLQCLNTGFQYFLIHPMGTLWTYNKISS